MDFFDLATKYFAIYHPHPEEKRNNNNNQNSNNTRRDDNNTGKETKPSSINLKETKQL